MGEPQAFLHNTYLVTGEYDSTAGKVVRKTLAPVCNRFFTRMNHQEQSLISTDDRGMLGSVNSSGQFLQRINDANLGSLKLNPVPPGLARQSYFAFDKDWQKKLIEHARAVNLTAPLRPIPVTFTYDDLREPTDEGEKAIFQKFQRLTCKGQLIPKSRVLTLLIDKAVLASVPATLHARQGSTVLALQAARSPIRLTVDGHGQAEYVVYAAAGATVKEGSWVVKIPAQAVDTSWRRRDAQNLDIQRTIQVAFSVHTLFGDFDFQHLEFPSVEQALVTHFAERYEHLTASDEGPSDKPGQVVYAEAASALIRLRGAFAVADAKRKMVAGFVNADTSARGRQIAIAALGAVRDSNNGAISDAAGVGAQLLTQAYDAKEVIESWKAVLDKMRIKRDMAAALKLTEALMDANGIERFWRKNKWRDTVMGAIRESQGKKPNPLGNYLLFCKENADKTVLDKLMKDAFSPRLTTFETLCGGNIAAKALWAVDTAVTIQQLAETFAAVLDLRASEEVAVARLSRQLEEYGKRFKGAPCTEATARLEVLRMAADAAIAGTDEKTAKLVEMVAKQTLRGLTLVPVVGQFAALTSLAVESLEALGSVVDLASDMIDRFTWRHRSSIQRFSELARLHAIQCRAIANAKEEPGSPHTQLRVRIIVLIGLLRLIERCGSRQADPGAFAKKVEQYQIGAYISHYVLARKPFYIAINGGTPLDEIWHFAAGNRETSWNDLVATLTSTGNTITELIRGSGRAVVSVNFHKYFPIHGVEAKNAQKLARILSVNFSGVVDKAMVFSRVYVRRSSNERWGAAEDAPFKIQPGTAVRVVAVFQSKDDLTGVPMSLQIKRVDPVFNIDGPVYKSCLAPVTASLGDDVDDKGLLPYLEGEQQYIGKKDTYSCVFYPFYFFKKHLTYGLKPFGFIGLSGNITLDMALDIKAGDDGKLARTGNRGATSVRMHMSTRNPLHVDMILNREFLNHKAPEPHYENLFNFPWNTMQVGGVYTRGGGESFWRRATEKSTWYTKDPYAVVDFVGLKAGFAWGKAFELLVIFGSPFAAYHRWPEDPIRFPARIYVKEPYFLGLLANEGPSYPVEVCSLRKGQNIQAMSAGDLLLALQTAGLLAEDKGMPGLGGLKLTAPCCLWAVRVAFNYHVEGKDGTMHGQSGLRPFGDEYRTKDDSYAYHFDIRSPEIIGLDLRDLVRLTVLGLPDGFLADTALAGTKEWVTNKALWPMTELEKLKLKK